MHSYKQCMYIAIGWSLQAINIYTIATYIHAYTPKLALVEDEDEIVDSAIKGKIKIFALIGESL